MLSMILKLSSLVEILSKSTKLFISILKEYGSILTGKLVRGNIDACWEYDILKIWFLNQYSKIHLILDNSIYILNN